MLGGAAWAGADAAVDGAPLAGVAAPDRVDGPGGVAVREAAAAGRAADGGLAVWALPLRPPARWLPGAVVPAGVASAEPALAGLARLGVTSGWAASVLEESWAGGDTGAEAGGETGTAGEAAGLPVARGPVASVVRATSRAGI